MNTNTNTNTNTHTNTNTNTNTKLGEYVISFIAEGGSPGGSSIDVSDIQPLVYRVKVIPNHVTSGIYDAINKLNATSIINTSQRHFRQSPELRGCLNNVNNEFDAVKCTLVSIYLALPIGLFILLLSLLLLLIIVIIIVIIIIIIVIIIVTIIAVIDRFNIITTIIRNRSI
jgi:hypothetical protein